MFSPNPCLRMLIITCFVSNTNIYTTLLLFQHHRYFQSRLPSSAQLPPITACDATVSSQQTVSNLSSPPVEYGILPKYQHSKIAFSANWNCTEFQHFPETASTVETRLGWHVVERVPYCVCDIDVWVWATSIRSQYITLDILPSIIDPLWFIANPRPQQLPPPAFTALENGKQKWNAGSQEVPIV